MLKGRQTCWSCFDKTVDERDQNEYHLPPLQHRQPVMRVQFRGSAPNRVDTPLLQATTFEHEHEHEHEHERRAPNAKRLVRADVHLVLYLGLKPQAESLSPFETKSSKSLRHPRTFTS